MRTAGAVLLLLLLLPFYTWPLWFGLLLVLAAAGGAYGAAHHLLVSRLRLAHTTLKQIRKHQFENLEAASVPRGDELNNLVWQVYRTGLALEKEIQELRKVENYRREYLSDVSHELKTPIFAIQGFAETLLDGALEDPDARERFVEKILRNASRLGTLTRDLAEISRIETGELKMTFAPFQLRRVMEEVIESLEPAAQAKGICVSCSVPENVPPVRGDRERIRQVLINLTDNAIKYNNPGGSVEVAGRLLASGEVQVSVVDDGIGIAPQDLPRLTERFYRVDRSRSRRQGGTGLGLAITKHILAAHDRQLAISSTLGQGTTFAFTLPLAGEAAHAARRPAGGTEAGARG